MSAKLSPAERDRVVALLASRAWDYAAIGRVVGMSAREVQSAVRRIASGEPDRVA